MLVQQCYCAREWGWGPPEHYQREGMGNGYTIEYQAMPSLRDVALGILEYEAMLPFVT
jgi:hypothetical protein